MQHIDTVLAVAFDHYLDLDSAQAAALREGIAHTVAWHRTHEVPATIEALVQLQRRIAHGEIAAIDVDAIEQAVGASIDRTLVESAPALARLAVSLRPSQIATLQRRFDHANADYRDEWGGDDARGQRTKRYEKSLEQFERWTGRFDRTQRADLRARIDAMHLDDDLPIEQQTRYVERVRRQRALMALIAQVQAHPPSDAEARDLVHRYVEQFDSGASPERRAYEERVRTEADRLIAETLAHLSSDQRRTAVERLQRWIDDLRAMRPPSA